MRIVSVICLFLAALTAWSAEAPEKSLFPVSLSHPFPDAAAAFEQARSLILANFYDSEITEEALYWAAIEGMLRHVSPPDNPDLGRLWTAAEYAPVADTLRGEQVSLGLRSSFSAAAGSLTVTEILEGSPAAGILRAHDRIMRIDGVKLTGKSVDEVSAMLEGDAGTEVKLIVVRDIDVVELTVVRERHKVANLKVEQLSEDTAFVVLRRISEGISRELKAQLEAQVAAGVERVIIDLRGNSGGVFAEALRLAELFLPAKSILLRTRKRDGRQTYISSNGAPFSCALAVLVDANTASSCEILVGALQDHRRALVFGVPTYGKGVFEKTFELDNACRMKFIIGAMYTPRARTWQSHGIKPDFKVDQEGADLNALAKLPARTRLNRDLAVLTAYKVLHLEPTTPAEE